jgi:hypothetical protein
VAGVASAGATGVGEESGGGEGATALVSGLVEGGLFVVLVISPLPVHPDKTARERIAMKR